jgi:hypothetical protein
LAQLKINKMEGYLGQKIVDIVETPFKGYTKEDWVMYFIEHCGQHDGGHHKQWVLDQIARILKGTPIIIKLAKWEKHTPEYRISTDKPSREYKNWVIEMCGEQDEEGEYEYDYDEGIAP